MSFNQPVVLGEDTSGKAVIVGALLTCCDEVQIHFGACEKQMEFEPFCSAVEGDSLMGPRVHGWMDAWMDRWMHGFIVPWADGGTDQWFPRWTGRFMAGMLVSLFLPGWTSNQTSWDSERAPHFRPSLEAI